MKVKAIKGFSPTVTISKIAMDKMLEYIHQSNLEIGWLGCAEHTDKGYHISDVFLFKQEVHSTTTEITTEGLSEFAMELMQDENGVEKWNNMRVWGHSHVNMTTFASGQDEKQMDLFIENSNDFFIRIIANKKEDFKIDIWDFNRGVIYEDMEYIVEYGEEISNQIGVLKKQIEMLKERINALIGTEPTLKDEIANEIKQKVTEKKYTNYKGYGANHKYNSDWWNNNKKNEANIKRKGVEEIFDELSDTEIYMAMEMIELGGTSIDVLEDHDLTIYESYELDALIEEYVEKEKEDYYTTLQEWYE